MFLEMLYTMPTAYVGMWLRRAEEGLEPQDRQPNEVFYRYLNMLNHSWDQHVINSVLHVR